MFSQNGAQKIVKIAGNNDLQTTVPGVRNITPVMKHKTLRANDDFQRKVRLNEFLDLADSSQRMKVCDVLRPT